RVSRPTRNRPGAAPTSSRKGLAGGGAMYGSPGTYPETASRIAAVSRTVRVTACSIVIPAHASPASGPSDVRPREGFRPTSPHSLAGMRIEPPPSFACAAGTIPEATAAAEPPLDPPGDRVLSHGFRVGP